MVLGESGEIIIVTCLYLAGGCLSPRAQGSRGPGAPEAFIVLDFLLTAFTSSDCTVLQYLIESLDVQSIIKLQF